MKLEKFVPFSAVVAAQAARPLISPCVRHSTSVRYMERQQRIERDTLGLDVCLPRCLHVDVLEACDRALERSLAAQARSADAPRAPDAPPAPAPTQPPKPQPPITAAQLAQARAMAQSCLPAEPAPQASEVQRTIDAAELAWLPPAAR